MRKYLIILVIFFTAAVHGQERPMTPTEIEIFKAQAERTSQATTALSWFFVQFKHMDFLDDDIETSGKLAFKAPGLVRWEYTKPYQYSVIFKDDKLLINDGGRKSDVDIGNNRLFKKLNSLIVNSVKGTMFEDADFSIKYFKIEKANKVIFIPKDKKIARYIAAFELLFDLEDTTVLEVKMVEPSSDFTQIVFSNKVLNSPLDDAVFTN